MLYLRFSGLAFVFISRLQDLEGTLEIVFNYHHRGGIIEFATVVGC
jgi:hypothetical protein